MDAYLLSSSPDGRQGIARSLSFKPFHGSEWDRGRNSTSPDTCNIYVNPKGNLGKELFAYYTYNEDA